MSDNQSLVPVPAGQDFSHPKTRQQLRAQLRAAEWAMHQKLMIAAQTALDKFLSNPTRVTAQDIARLTELGLSLGRSACGLAGAPEEPPRGPIISLEFRAAIEKAHGQPVPAEFIDAESEVAPVSQPVTGPSPE